MSNVIKFKRGLESARTFTPASGEPVWTTDAKNLYVGDGTTVGGVSVTKSITDKLGAVSGIATLDANGKVPLTQINDALLGNVKYQGTWNANTNTPTLPAATNNKGNYWVTSVSGTYNSISFVVGDWVISNGTAYEKVDNTDAVSSVFGRTGVVTAQSGDYTTTQVTEGTNLYYTNTRVSDYLVGGISSILTTNLTASKALISNSSGKVADSTVTSTELGYLSGVTSSIQTQLNNKRSNTSPVSGSWWQGTPLLTGGGVMEIGRYIDFHSASANTSDYDARIDANNNEIFLYSPLYSGGKKIFHEGLLVGAVSNILTSNLTASKALVSDSSGKVAASSVSSTELGYLSGVTSSIQNQIDAKSTTLYVNGGNVGYNGTSEWTLTTVTIPANTISYTGILKVTIQGYVNLNAAGSATFRVKLGGNTFFTFTRNYDDSDSVFEVVLYISTYVGIYKGTSYNDGYGVGAQMLADRKAIETDFTISRDLVVTAQGSVAINGASLDHLVVERV